MSNTCNIKSCNVIIVIEKYIFIFQMYIYAGPVELILSVLFCFGTFTLSLS